MKKSLLVFLALAALLLSSCVENEDGPRFLSKEEIEEVRAMKREALADSLLKVSVEYRQGDCPVILTVPHGGTALCSDLKVRTASNCPDPDLANDLDYNTRELADEIDKAYFQLTGHHPYMVIARIKRDHVDFNRQKKYAVPYGDEIIESIYDRYHNHIADACREVTSKFGHGLLFDIHGQSHSQHIELGYLLSVSSLNLTDAVLDSDASYANGTSIRHLVTDNRAGLSFSGLLRGEKSFGSILHSHNLECVPRPGYPSPGSSPYFNGGYTTKQYGSVNTGVIDAIQAEFRYSYRDSENERKRVAAAFAQSIEEFTSTVW